MRKQRKDTISVRMPIDMLDQLDDEVAEHKWDDRSQAIITRIQDSYHLEQLMEIAKDPELQSEMNEKIKTMLVNSDIEKSLETMSIKERNTIIFFAQNLNKKMLQQVKL